MVLDLLQCVKNRLVKKGKFGCYGIIEWPPYFKSIVTLKFTINILTILTYSLKLYVLAKKISTNQTFSEPVVRRCSVEKVFLEIL